MSDMETVKARYPGAYTCSEEREDLVFITRGPGRDLSAKFDTEAEAWANARALLETKRDDDDNR